MADIEKLVEQLSTLTVLEAADLAKALEEKWGVSAAAAVAVAGPAAAAAPAAEEQTEFDVILTGDGGNKIAVTRKSAHHALGLTEAKALVESAPKAIKEAVNTAEPREIKRRSCSRRNRRTEVIRFRKVNFSNKQKGRALAPPFFYAGSSVIRRFSCRRGLYVAQAPGKPSLLQITDLYWGMHVFPGRKQRIGYRRGDHSFAEQRVSQRNVRARSYYFAFHWLRRHKLRRKWLSHSACGVATIAAGDTGVFLTCWLDEASLDAALPH